MSKFEVLKNNAILMTRLGIFSPESLTNQNNDFVKSPITYYTSFKSIAFMISSAVFVYQNASNFDLALRTFIVIIGQGQSFGMFISFAKEMKKIKILHHTLQELVDETAQDEENDRSNIEQKCRKFTKMMTYYICFHLSAFVIAITHAVIDICSGNFDTSMWNTPFNVVVPFNSELVWVWFLKWFFQFGSSFSYVITMVLTTTYFVSFCLYINTICNHFNEIMNSIQLNVGFIHNEENPQRKQKLWKDVKEKFHQAIKIHVKVYEVFHLARDISSGTIFSFLPINAIVMGLSMYTMEHSEFNVVVFGFDIICTCVALMWPALFCYYANLATDRVAAIGNSVYDLNWFEYPMEIQKYTMLIIARSQKPVYFVGFNLIRCTLEVFGKLFKSSCSYYLVFRSFSE